jgi:O-antigen chain-terminating methyltransferase
LLQFYPKGQLVDLGCGRGEWLELTTEHGFQAQGVDLDDGMLQNARELGLTVHKLDALTFLQQLPDNSQTIVSGFHIAEHIAFDQLKQLVQEAKRVLVPGGLLILETPNPENLVVGTSSFYLDPTHQRPIPPELLHFLPEHYGYARQKIIRLQEPPHLVNSLNTSLLDVMGGVSPDYSVIAQTKAADEVLQVFDAPFSQNYGLSLYTLAERFQQNMSIQIEIAESAARTQLQQALQVAQTAQAQMRHAESVAQAQLQQALQVAQTAQEQMQHALAKAEHRQKQIEAIQRSWSWRLTWPVRLAGDMAMRPRATIRTLGNQTLAWGLNTFQKPLTHAMAWVLVRPQLTSRINGWLIRWPHLHAHLLAMARRNGVLYRAFNRSVASNQDKNKNGDPSQALDQLSPRVRQIYADLKAAIDQQHKGGH